MGIKALKLFFFLEKVLVMMGDKGFKLWFNARLSVTI